MPLAGYPPFGVLSRSNRGHVPISREIDLMSPNREIPSQNKKGPTLLGQPFAFEYGRSVFDSGDTQGIQENSDHVTESAISTGRGRRRSRPGRRRRWRPARPGTIGPGPGLVDRQRTALEVLAIESGNSLVGLFLVRHLDEAETAAPS